MTHLVLDTQIQDDTEKKSVEKKSESNDFDWVVSGINHGSNLGSDIYYSGTVAGAREGCLRGYPSIAISLHPNGSGPLEKIDFDTASLVVPALAETIERFSLIMELKNVDFPALGFPKILILIL